MHVCECTGEILMYASQFVHLCVYGSGTPDIESLPMQEACLEFCNKLNKFLMKLLNCGERK